MNQKAKIKEYTESKGLKYSESKTGFRITKGNTCLIYSNSLRIDLDFEIVKQEIDKFINEQKS